MPTKSLTILCALCFVLVYSPPALAQDDRMPDLDSGIKENRTESPAEITPEAEFRSLKPATVSRDSVQIKPATRRDPKSKPEDSSVLSFNFLYYLIERFKLSDIVD